MATNRTSFENSFNPKCIYVFRINDDDHKGLLKIGDAIVKTNKPLDALVPNCKELNQAAKLRIKDYTNTAGIDYDLLYTELAVMEVKDEDGFPVLVSFKDHKVHEVLKNSHIEKKEFPNSTAREWFEVDLETAKKAIAAVKDGKKNLSGEQITHNYDTIVFRPEQKEAIQETLKRFKTQNRMLWNAKMRFGKTLSALEVVRKSNFEKTIIITHRPVVDAGWYEDFNKIFSQEGGAYIYGSKSSGTTLHDLLESGKKFVYFASLQDLRGSVRVGGNFDKNDDVFDLEWDFVIVDEAHEGTTTLLGDTVIQEVVKEKSGHVTKFLALSGTPFNILNDYDTNIYTWDYIMEQKAKREWSISHLEPNPYDDLPEMRIFTYDIGKLLFDERYIELEDKAFNFREFFRVWTGDKDRDRMEMPEGVSVGDFYHEEDVESFLNLICQASEESQYPYANEEYRNIFKHTLWMVPGVKEAKALSKMLKNHAAFSFFEIVNVAGEGDEEEAHDEALKKVRKAIKKAGENGYTITLSCGKLTTGVTVPEWTAAFYLAGSVSTSATSYLQTVFRVQSPCNKYGKVKNVCYVFDFAPDRTLKMVAEAAAISTKAGGTSSSDRMIMGEFLNYCPVISIDGTRMKEYDTNNLLQQLKMAYAERAVRTGFDDTKIYSDELLKLTDGDLSLLNDVKGIIGTSKASHTTDELPINQQGFDEEEYKKAEEAKKKKPKTRTPEEEALLKELAEKRKQRNSAISVLRGISIRMPLLIYGANVPFDDDVTIEQLTDLIDDASWTEFMPSGITKDRFKELIKFYDPDIFVAAGRRIRNTAKSADELPPIERAQKIAELFSYFKNPDKETVLTPWRVVNMQLGECLGGWNFFDEDLKSMVETPRYVNMEDVTENVFKADTRILEINSKTGLYPLYIASSIFLNKINLVPKEKRTIEKQEELWRDTIESNVYVVCNTPMAKTITQRTLVGYKDYKINAHAFDDMLNQFSEKSSQFINKVTLPSFWGKKGNKMHFNAVVGNPPYQLSGASGGTSDASIYQYFAETASNLHADYVSLIMPSRWFAAGRENLLGDFRKSMLNDKRIRKLTIFPTSREVFPSVEIKGGICYYLMDENYNGLCEYSLVENGERNTTLRDLGELDVLIKDPTLSEIVKKIMNQTNDGETVDSIISSDTPFGIGTNPKASEKNGFDVRSKADATHSTLLIHIEKQHRKAEYIDRSAIHKNAQDIDKYKVFIPTAGGSGNDDLVLGAPICVGPNSVCSQSFLYAAFETEEEAQNFMAYVKTKFFRVLVSSLKITQSAAKKVYRFVPLQDFSKAFTDDMLYKKYMLSKKDIEFIESRIREMP